MNAKKPSNDILRKFPVSRGADQTEKCAVCSHELGAHDGTVCPALPPAKADQVTVDEAVVAKGGKPSSDFVQQLEDATGATATKAKEAAALERFNAEPVELPAETLPIKLKEIRPNPRNPREKLTNIPELAAALEAEGMLTPITVRLIPATAKQPDFYEIISGHRRFAAAQKLDWDTVPCIVLDGVDDARALELNLVEQVQREQLEPIEEASALRELIELAGYSEEQVAKKFGRSVTWVRRRVLLLNLAPEARKLVSERLIPLDAAGDLALLPHAQQAEAVKDLRTDAQREDGEITKRRALLTVHEFTRPLKEAPFDIKREYVAVSAPACVKCPKNSACGPRGLFDNFNTKSPSCSDLGCFTKKSNAHFDERAEQLRAEGAEVLSKTESQKLFEAYDGKSLGYGSKYVAADSKNYDDAKNRTWGQLAAAVPEKNRPQLIVAQDRTGALRELYVYDSIKAAAQKHAGVKRATSSANSYDKKAREEAKKRKHRNGVVDEVLEAVATDVASNGLDVPDLKLLADAVYSQLGADAFDGPFRALGLLGMKPEQVEKWIANKASQNELEALIFTAALQRSSVAQVWRGLDPELNSLATRYGLNAKNMLHAREVGAKSEEAIKAKKKGKAA
jgi:ParB/RepB/Spo0J family partition protein